MNYKDCQEWKNVGFPLSTTSNEAAKMYDAALTQFTTGYEDKSIGGVGICLEKMLSADPSFVLGHAIKNGMALLSGVSILTNDSLKSDIDKMVEMAKTSDITPLEKLHVDAVKLWSVGNIVKGCDKWEEVLLYFPTDIMAIQGAMLTHLFYGRMMQFTDCLARVLPFWNSCSSPKVHCAIRSQYAFGLEELNFFDDAEKIAKQALEVTPNDIWGTHTIAHVRESQNHYEEGISFIKSKESDIQDNYLSGHIYWHLGLYYIEKGDFEAALTLYDDRLSKYLSNGAMVDMTDASSFLCRLEFEGVNVGDRWQKVHERFLPHLHDHVYMFNDIHGLMASQRAKQFEVAEKLIESIMNFISNADEENAKTQVFRDVGVSLCESFQAYDNGEYGRAVDIITPIKYRIQEIGGSKAQRDVFNLFLIHAALKSSEKRHHMLARSLLHERSAQRKCSPMNDRLFAQLPLDISVDPNMY
ncbi:tetratricopeptide repeat protein 38-like isoform X2 [Ptychodera flava]|uniref:tetratricopeptide repeat protein 38-like isoform X2 n=1 Tax=Ptychodera flava TaxID=63121 RepID=UPI00396A421A